MGTAKKRPPNYDTREDEKLNDKQTFFTILSFSCAFSNEKGIKTTNGLKREMGQAHRFSANFSALYARQQIATKLLGANLMLPAGLHTYFQARCHFWPSAVLLANRIADCAPIEMWPEQL